MDGWALAFAAPMIGSKLVMPGPKLDGPSIYELLETEKVTMTAAVPTVWLMLLQDLEKTGKMLPHLRRVLIGGSACPPSMIEVFERKYDVEVVHAWGMTEMSPLGSLGTIKATLGELSSEQQLAYKAKQGHPPFGVEMKIVDDEDRELPRDGKAFGRLKVRGPAVAKGYFRGEGTGSFDADGWFDTGDVAMLDRHGYMTITDRAKDVIKSGGEWISSIEIENVAVGHPSVAEAAVRDLENARIPSADIKSYTKDEPAYQEYRTRQPEHQGGFWSWLIGEETGQTQDYGAYDTSLASGHTVVTVTVDEVHADAAMGILNQHGPHDIHEQTSGASENYQTGTAAYTATQPTNTSGVTGGREEEVIPLAEEQLQVGKRTVDRGTTSIRRYVVRKPVEESVTLRDETVTVERRRPVAAGEAGMPAGAFEERTIEVHQTAEEPVVSKTAHIAEEVVVRKDVTERTETVRDDVRREQVDVRDASQRQS